MNQKNKEILKFSIIVIDTMIREVENFLSPIFKGDFKKEIELENSIKLKIKSVVGDKEYESNPDIILLFFKNSNDKSFFHVLDWARKNIYKLRNYPFTFVGLTFNSKQFEKKMGTEIIPEFFQLDFSSGENPWLFLNYIIKKITGLAILDKFLKKEDFNFKGMKFYSDKRYELAIENFEEAIKLYPKDYDSLSNLGYSYIDSKNPSYQEKGEQLCLSAIEINFENLMQENDLDVIEIHWVSDDWKRWGDFYGKFEDDEEKKMKAEFCYKRADDTILLNIHKVPEDERKEFLQYTTNLRDFSKKLKERIEEIELEKKRKFEEEQQIEKEKKEIINKIRQIMSVSDKFRLDMLRDILKMEFSDFNARLLDWAVEFGFKIDGDYIIFGSAGVEDFIRNLDKQFELWTKIEKKKIF